MALPECLGLLSQCSITAQRACTSWKACFADYTGKQKSAKRGKYGTAIRNADKPVYNGIRFDSKHEMRQYIKLERLQAAGEISDLKRSDTRFKFVHNGVLIGSYRPDFEWTDKNGEHVYADAKSVATKKARDYSLRKKLLLAFEGIKIIEL